MACSDSLGTLLGLAAGDDDDDDGVDGDLFKPETQGQTDVARKLNFDLDPRSLKGLQSLA